MRLYKTLKETYQNMDHKVRRGIAVLAISSLMLPMFGCDSSKKAEVPKSKYRNSAEGIKPLKGGGAPLTYTPSAIESARDTLTKYGASKSKYRNNTGGIKPLLWGNKGDKK